MRNKSLVFLALALGIALVTVLWNFSSVFYGFEYEDCFINSSVAIEEDLSESTLQFRANPHAEIELGQTDGSEFYSGHYIPYAAYLWTLKKVFDLKDSYLMHRIGNLILILMTLISCYYLSSKEERTRAFFLISICLCSFPVIYVLNSGLKENLSFCLGLLVVVVASRKEKYLYLMMILVLVISLVKRENLIYICIPFIVLPKTTWIKIKFLIPLLCIVAVQLLINPFFTEGLESNDIGRNTFSFDFLSYQGPTYLLSMLHWSGFGLLTIILLTAKMNRKSLFLILSWLGLFLLYSSHYRSKYSIEVREIDLFDTYRYMVNAIPLLFAAILLSERRDYRWLQIGEYSVLSLALILFILFIGKISNYIEQEEYNYHYSSEFIKENYGNCTVLDNYSLVSRLDFNNSEDIDIRVLDSVSINSQWKEPVLVINRFNSEPIDYWLNDQYKLVRLDPPALFLIEKLNDDE
jgi:hypothetical protein